jgi:Protein of unknown function (DUF5656)
MATKASRRDALLSTLSVRPRPPRTGIAYVAVRLVVYLAALVLIVLVYGTKERGLFIAPPIGLLCAAATWYLLGDTHVEPKRRLWLAAAVGLLQAELTWAFGYWPAVPVVGGAALWLGFYVLSGVVEAGANNTLDRRITLEYGIVASIGVIVVAAVSHPWMP